MTSEDSFQIPSFVTMAWKTSLIFLPTTEKQIPSGIADGLDIMTHFLANIKSHAGQSVPCEVFVTIACQSASSG